ncbi:hypothetical protein E3N88_14008 [Mikania micrantha]|uniref:Uncharacterized protein n=1 Tax=Mikania micrantha TaxID=192012 RepID=A0A5N6P1G6_9ASTR|nr:hypothetical protein E3N88_14008 [Mikania micrantha]
MRARPNGQGRLATPFAKPHSPFPIRALNHLELQPAEWPQGLIRSPSFCSYSAERPLTSRMASRVTWPNGQPHGLIRGHSLAEWPHAATNHSEYSFARPYPHSSVITFGQPQATFGHPLAEWPPMRPTSGHMRPNQFPFGPPLHSVNLIRPSNQHYSFGHKDHSNSPWPP